MKSTTLAKNARRERRSHHVRTRLRSETDVPRLSIFRSSKHIYAQVIDDRQGRTVAHASSTSKALGDRLNGKNKTERAKIVGSEIARRAIESGVQQVVFDRGYAKYHGRVKALADAAREAGLEF